ncbi:MAG: flavodoxin family protein [bacterium]|nr:flavodoxin family protein [bacterium]
MAMKRTVLAVSASPRAKSFTDKILSLFLEGMGEDIELHKFYPHRMKINPCTGCFTCWLKTPGVCVQQDDMTEIMKWFNTADVIILASPLYVFGFTAQMKTVLDRLIPSVECYITTNEKGFSYHKRRLQKSQKMVLISSCGFPEIENFEVLKQHYLAVVNHWGEDAGMILISGSGAANIPHFFDEKYRLIRQAGKELVEFGKVTQETMDNIASEIIDRQVYRDIANAAFKGGLKGSIKTMVKSLQAVREKDSRTQR